MKVRKNGEKNLVQKNPLNLCQEKKKSNIIIK